MSKFGIPFGARDIVMPGVYARVGASRMVPPRGTPSRTVAILATAQGGEVGGVTRITSPEQIPTRLIGGVGAELTALAMAPSGELQGAGSVDFVRVGQAVSATLNLGDATLTFKPAGKVGNGASCKRTTAADGSVSLLLEHRHLGLREEYRDLGNVLRLTYVGDAETPSVTIASEAGVTTLTLVGDETLTFDSDTFPTVDALIDRLNDTSEWTARALGSLAAVSLTDLTTGAVALTDGVGVLSIGAAAYAYALADSPNFAAAVTPGGSASPDGVAFFAGGSEGATPTTQDWLDALARIKDRELYGVVIGTGDLAVITAAKAAVEAASDAKNRRERQLYVGPAKQASKGAFKEAVTSLATGAGGARVVIAASEPMLVNTATSRLQAYPAYYLAAMQAGMKAGNPPEVSLTNKQVAIFGTSFAWDVEDIEELLEAGCSPVRLDPTSGDYVIVQGITSWTRDANVTYRKVSGMDIADDLNKGIRQRLARFTGKVGDQLTIREILLEVTGFLTEKTRTSSNPSGTITAGINPVTGEEEPAFRDVEVVMDGFDLVGIKYEAHPVGEIAFITATAYLTPVKLVARA